MNSLPMRLRLVSGSVTSIRRSRNRLLASTWIRLILKASRNVETTASASPFRRSPLSTKRQVSWSPMALCRSTATTDESTPPDRAQSTRSAPTVVLMAATSLSMKDFIDQSPVAPQAARKFRSTVLPCAVCATSGWNCTPNSIRAGSAMGGHRAVLRGAEGREAGRRLHHGVAMAHPHADVTVAAPFHLIEEPALARDEKVGGAVLAPLGGHHLAAQEVAHGLHAVADAEYGNARLEELPIGQGRPLVVDAGWPSGKHDTLVALGEDLLQRAGDPQRGCSCRAGGSTAEWPSPSDRHGPALPGARAGLPASG